MKFSTLIISTLLLWLNVSHADDNLTTHHNSILSNNYSNLGSVTFDSFPILYIDPLYNEKSAQLAGDFTTGRLTIKTGAITSKSTVLWRKYYLNSAVTIHQNKAFNLSLTAGIEQFKNNNLTTNKPVTITNNNFYKETKLNYSYGLVGSYSVNNKWYVSGGIIHSAPIHDVNDSWQTSNNMALIGTTYSF